MSALTDLFTNLASKIRVKLGTTTKYTPAQAVAAIDQIYDKGVSSAKVGTANEAAVLKGKTFTNATAINATGTMPDYSTGSRKQVVWGTGGGNTTPAMRLDSDGNNYTIAVPKGYWNWSYDNSSITVPAETKSYTPSTASTSIGPTNGKMLKTVSVAAVPTVTTTITAKTTTQSVSPPAGKFFSNVSVNAIATQNKTVTAGASASTVATNAYVVNTIVNPTPSEPKSWTPAGATTITPSAGKLLNQVTVAAVPTTTLAVTPKTTAQSISMTDGKYFSKVTVSAIATQNKTVTAKTSASTVSTNGYVVNTIVNPTPSTTETITAGTASTAHTPPTGYFYSKVTVKPTPTTTVTVTPKTTTQSISPPDGKHFSKVSVNAVSLSGDAAAANVLSGKTFYTTSLTKSTGSMTNHGSVTATLKPNDKKTISAGYVSASTISAAPCTGTYTYGTGSTGGKYDMGVANVYRYVVATNVYNKGKADGASTISRLHAGYAYEGCSGTISGSGTLLIFANAYVDNGNQTPTATVKIGTTSKTATATLRSEARLVTKVWQLSVANGDKYSLTFSAGGSGTLRYMVDYVVWFIKKP